MARDDKGFYLYGGHFTFQRADGPSSLFEIKPIIRGRKACHPRAFHCIARPRARYKVKFPRVSFTFRSRNTGTKIYTYFKPSGTILPEFCEVVSDTNALSI